MWLQDRFTHPQDIFEAHLEKQGLKSEVRTDLKVKLAKALRSPDSDLPAVPIASGETNTVGCSLAVKAVLGPPTIQVNTETDNFGCDIVLITCASFRDGLCPFTSDRKCQQALQPNTVVMKL